MSQKTILIMAGGTGGHIMPGLAVAHELELQGHKVVWLGGVKSSMEAKLVPQQGIEFNSVEFGGVRGKGVATKLLFPLRLAKAVLQARRVMSKVKPDVVLGMGGYITVPGGIAAKMAGVPIVLHEQNSIVGMSNKFLAKMAKRVLSGFPDVLPNATWVGNPVKQAIVDVPAPDMRYAEHEGPLQIAVVGGSLGAQALNSVVPQALALMPEVSRPLVIHQAGEKMIAQLRENYAQAKVEAQCVPFINDMAALYGKVDMLICRSGAMTVSELAAAGVPSIMVPFPFAVDDHQTTNAALLTKVGAGVCIQQADLTAQRLADELSVLTRDILKQRAVQARSVAKPKATQDVAQACLDVAKTAA
ncbi:undecaprenyldiphospho-muramoylpentapeptide beta-N-acetylglucosaminyltransferase [Hydromonas duriensis]|uniref:UDP-N-acetylglucosamine--N-acetylmuramyl-(pentapeptide) pyrophosphoryl-undecaprenol N-acetylglucosamine transferase n=1 Tax=Hydromonas duriensis TaxID=1527608 RepID=A0A4R6Y738_9BURK|nr:undecaprenyldiphospho-muramoylpentapeptide beta-N-acetylglucosaminyltransferase [Hydromonas duriensis]TDR30837.1 UDP-N-acetylglucosamine-N-acetylmuramylpentapeptide N-acetylglucosamine transferase [Hydromonas duriensis]